jgi:hypothetical protein
VPPLILAEPLPPELKPNLANVFDTLPPVITRFPEPKPPIVSPAEFVHVPLLMLAEPLPPALLPT